MNKSLKIMLIVLIAVLFSATLTYGGWEPQESGTSANLNGVSFVDPNIGTAVGNNGVIIHTTNAGLNWTLQSSGLSAGLLDVSFYDVNNGTAVGHEGTIIYTNDGGANWITAQTGWMTSYYGTQMVTSALSFAVGVNTIFQPLVEKTTNGWQSWNSYIFYLDNNEGRLNDVYFIDESNGFAAARAWTGQGVVVKSVNGGQNWSTVYWTDHALSSLDFPSPEIGYAVGNSGTLIKSSDGGNSWGPLSTGVSSNLYDVVFPFINYGYAVGEGGLIIKTVYGGHGWNAQESGVSVSLNKVCFPSVNTGYIVGDDGTILFTATGGDDNEIYEYLPGDVNMTLGLWPPRVIGSDLTYLIRVLRGLAQPCFLGGFFATADINGDCNVIGSDVTRFVQYFRIGFPLLACPDIEPAWLTPDDLPDEAPEGWPNCDNIELNSGINIIPVGNR